MIKEFSSKCTLFVVEKGSFSHDKEPILCYGFELIIITIIGFLILIVASIVFNQPLAWLWFLLGFAPLRTTAGGYHASSHVRCYLTTTGMFASGLSLATLIEWPSTVCSIIGFISVILVLMMSPVEADRKRLTKERIKRNRNKSIGIVFIEFTLAVILYLLNVTNAAVRIFYTGMAFASASLIMSRIAHRKRADNYSAN